MAYTTERTCRIRQRVRSTSVHDLHPVHAHLAMLELSRERVGCARTTACLAGWLAIQSNTQVQLRYRVVVQLMPLQLMPPKSFLLFRCSQQPYVYCAYSYRQFIRLLQACPCHSKRILDKQLCCGRGTARRACQQKFCNYKISLSCGIICVILRLAVFTQYRSVTDTHTDGRTDTRQRHVLRLAQRCAVKIDHFYCTRPTKYNYYAGNERRLTANCQAEQEIFER